MALVLKNGAQYSNPANGELIPTPYAVISEVSGDLQKKRQSVVVSVYQSKRMYLSGAKPVEVRRHGCQGKDFNNFFSPATLLKEGNSMYKAAELFVLQVQKLTAGPVDSDEIPLVWGDNWKTNQQDSSVN